MLDHANAAVRPLPDNTTKLKMEKIHVAFKVGAGGTLLLTSATAPDVQVGSQAFEHGGGDTERSQSVSQSVGLVWLGTD